ncbi:alpha/beta hydrolase family protein [Streptomyces albus subsp. chlorinus]|uniref:alpha/beta hydrolase family protein n=1 Tax=Streptomyces albus TaxID=1888 RepID=UPI0031F6BE20
MSLDRRGSTSKERVNQVTSHSTDAGRLQVPPPGGPHRVGTQALPFLDPDRADPWQPHRCRELMVQLWYPAAPLAGSTPPPARYLTLPVAAHVLQMWAEEGEEFGAGPHEALAGVRVHATEGAPVADGTRRPLVLLSPGLGEYRAGLTALAEDLASRGFVVAGVDHPGDAAAVEFPNGRVVPHHEPKDEEGSSAADGSTTDVESRYLATRVADLRFVLDQLLASPSPWHGVLDTTRVGVAGHSLGGAAAAELARTDARPAAIAVLDGSLYGPVLSSGLDLPVLLCGLTPPDPEDPDILAGWDRLWPLLRGPRHHTAVRGAGHMSATDFDVLAGPLGLRDPDDPDDAFSFGTLPPGRGIALVRVVLTAFFNEHLRNSPTPIPHAAFPELSLDTAPRKEC